MIALRTQPVVTSAGLLPKRARRRTQNLVANTSRGATCTLVDENRSAGRYGATWDGRDDEGQRVASGVYYIRMQTRAEMKRQKVVVLR